MSPGAERREERSTRQSGHTRKVTGVPISHGVSGHMPIRRAADLLVLLSGKGVEQMTSDQEQRSGTIIRASDGTLYFITPKLLEACRVPEDERDLVERAQTTEGNEEFSFTSGSCGK
jgi:hypothetical protein